MERTHSIILCTALVFVGLAENAHASVLVISDATRGYFTPSTNSGLGLAGNNYRAGFCPGPPGGCMSGPAEFRDFFTFAIPQLDGPVISAVLTLSTAGVSTEDSASMTYQITSIPSVFGFTDLGTGTVYGSRVYTAGRRR